MEKSGMSSFSPSFPLNCGLDRRLRGQSACRDTVNRGANMCHILNRSEGKRLISLNGLAESTRSLQNTSVALAKNTIPTPECVNSQK